MQLGKDPVVKNRWPLCCVIILGLVGSAADVWGQGSTGGQRYAQAPSGGTAVPQQSSTTPQVGAARNQAEVQVQLPAELETILQTWEQQTAPISRMKGTFDRYDYDAVFQIVKWAEGRYFYDQPDKGRMDFIPHRRIPEEPKNRVVANGVTYTVQADVAQSWVCTGKEILDVNHDQKTYNRVEIPPHYQGDNIQDGPLPFLFGMKAEELKKRYVMNLGDMHNPRGEQPIIHLIASPILAAQQREFRRAEILLDGRDYLPKAVKLWDTTGNKETVYVFHGHDQVRIPWPTSPVHINLFGYKLLNDVKYRPQSSAGTGMPGGAAPSRTAGANSGVFAR